jgi:hypothetical protein
MDDTQKAKNRVAYFKTLQRAGVDTTILDARYGKKLEDATMDVKPNYGVSYDGSLIECVLGTLAYIGLSIAGIGKKRMNGDDGESFETLFPGVDRASVVKVCLLQHIAKCIEYEAQDEEWKKTKLGQNYKYADTNSMKIGLRSLWMATDCGIKFTEDEAEAMCINDADISESSVKHHMSGLASVVRCANELMWTSFKQKMKK